MKRCAIVFSMNLESLSLSTSHQILRANHVPLQWQNCRLSNLEEDPIRLLRGVRYQKYIPTLLNYTPKCSFMRSPEISVRFIVQLNLEPDNATLQHMQACSKMCNSEPGSLALVERPEYNCEDNAELISHFIFCFHESS